MHQVSEQLRWSPTRTSLFAYKGDMLIEVSLAVFQRHFVALLAQQGIPYKTWSQLDREAREAWEKQGKLEDAFKANLDYWMALDGQGVIVRHQGVESHGERT